MRGFGVSPKKVCDLIKNISILFKQLHTKVLLKICFIITQTKNLRVSILGTGETMFSIYKRLFCSQSYDYR